MSKNIGLYFGTYNPVHVGHLIIANHMVEHTDLDEIWMVVTPHNPLKKKKTLLDDTHRLSMVVIAAEEYPKIKSSNIEFKLPQPNYTVYTLAHLSDVYPEHSFSLIMGEDNLKSLQKWKNYETILEYHQVYVYPRISKGIIETQFDNHPKIHRVNAPIVEISSSSIREGIREKTNVRPLLPESVWTYIDEMNFYKK